MELSKTFDKLLSKLKWSIYITLSVVAVLFALSIALVFMRGLPNFDSAWSFSVGADLCGMAVSIMILVGCVMNKNEQSDYYHFFVTMLSVIAVQLFLDVACWAFQGVPEYRIFCLIANVLYYANSSVLVFFFWRYVKGALGLNSKFMEGCNVFLIILYIPTLVACFVNFFYPLYFSVDENGLYARTDLFLFSQIFVVSGLIVFVIGLFVSKAPIKTKLVTGSFILVPLANQILTIRTLGITTQYAAMLVSVVLIYSVLVSDREKAMASTEKELSLATGIQLGMLPNIYPPYPDRKEFDIFASMNPAKEVGGDFFDFFFIDDDHLALVIADVSGKGVPAALFMMASKIMIKNTAMRNITPAQVLEEVNNQICSGNREEMFVTVWLGILNVKTGKLTAANAGHEYPVIRHAGGKYELFKDKHGFVIGGMSGVRYRDYEIQLEPGSAIFVYTDGLAEATDAHENLYGTDRMLEALNAIESDDPKVILAQIDRSVSQFVGEAPQLMI